ncbi:MAG: DegT/DnrJ/EryC1/StrS family aminotransferase [Lachnospiraceae bacterium]|nr:DegT/DnrJ/EryC1/StrS family aminotransferase [Lachnospiraceae bacterium]
MKTDDFKKILVTRSSMPTYEEYCEAIKPLWDSHWITNMGKYHKEFEKQIKDFLDVPKVSLTVNGHMALELAIQSYDFPEGSEVITTPFTFISTTHAIVRNRLKPVFCDVKESDGTIDETKIEDLITPNTVAILPVHVYGNICNVDEIQKIANKYGLKVIYDAAHAFGETYHSQGIGNFGDASIYSFHATKVFNSIEGGAVVCKTQEKYDQLYNLKNFGIRGEELVVSVGANAKMNEFCAIMGLLNLKYFNKSIEDRKRVFSTYHNLLDKKAGFRYLSTAGVASDLTPNYAYFPIVVLDDYPLTRDELYIKLAQHGIHARKYFYPLTSDQACFKNMYKQIDVKIARELSERVISLPIYEGMEQNDIERICDLL